MGLLKKSVETNKPPAFNLSVKISHQYLTASYEKQALYLLVDITHVSDLPMLRLPLNLCIVLDKSTSMRGLRLQQVKQAVQKIIDYLKPEDALSLVVFSDRAQVLLPSEKNVQKHHAKSLVSTIQPGGGTEMLQGLTAGLEQLRQYQSTKSVNHLIFLTDGQTYGDERGCLEQSQWAGSNQTSFTMMGIGEDWNETLLDQMATISGGTSIYIESPREVSQVFQSTIDTLSSVVARGMILTINTAIGVKLKEIYQMMPYISRLNSNSPEILLGPLANKTNKRLLMEFRIQTELAQSQDNLVQLSVEGDIPSHTNYRNWQAEEVVVEFSEQSKNRAIPSTIITALGKLAIFKLQEKTMGDLEHGEVATAAQRLETMAARLLNIGETELARSALLEAGRLARTGNLSAEGRKKIRYGTRSLSMLPKEIHR